MDCMELENTTVYTSQNIYTVYTIHTHMLKLLLVLSDENKLFAALVTDNTSNIIKVHMLAALQTALFPRLQYDSTNTEVNHIIAIQCNYQLQYNNILTIAMLSHIYVNVHTAMSNNINAVFVWENVYRSSSGSNNNSVSLIVYLLDVCVKCYCYYTQV